MADGEKSLDIAGPLFYKRRAVHLPGRLRSCIAIVERGAGSMPIIKSSMKDLRRTERRSARNRSAKGKVRSHLKAVRVALDSGKSDAAAAALAQATPTIDRAVSKGILHKNAAARHKARLMRRLKRATQPATS
jgi:small subunit ribosomal protein S20